MATPMFVPGAVQQWMCAAAAGAVRPLQVTSTFSTSAVSSRLRLVKPVAGLALGGFSFEPSITPWNTKTVACAEPARAIAAAAQASNLVDIGGLRPTETP